MTTTAARIYGKNDMRLETFALRKILPGEAIARVVCDSICMSTYKQLQRGKPSAVYPEKNADAPVIAGHELAAEIIETGEDVPLHIIPGMKFGVQAAMNINGEGSAPGYNYPEFGGAATRVIIPPHVLNSGFLLWYEDMPFFYASLGEPFACLIYALYGNFHTKPMERGFAPGILPGGSMMVMGGCGPMGLGMVELALNMDTRPSVIAVTDVNSERLAAAAAVIPPEYAAKKGITLHYVNTSEPCAENLKNLSIGEGFDDIYIMCPVREAIELADAVCAHGACMNFFAGPVDRELSAYINFHDVHYRAKHIVGSASSGIRDMKEAFGLMQAGRIRPEVMITHIGGIGSAVDATVNLPQLSGGKKLIYNETDLPLTAVKDFGKQKDPLFEGLDEICKRHGNLWCAEAENYLLRKYASASGL
ncbi:MAG: zinc-binding dehydrogenase [Defluviitaleaceae bacterium]|nr:zinc-binding dehydrogenase [Defluviitaleaceae bacterium]